jgi:Cd2+/Zn2+-exporting ATPase
MASSSVATPAVNQSAMTGESMPLEKQVGDSVYAGTLNESGAFDYRVTAAASDTMLARIRHAVEQAQDAKAPPSALSTALPASTPTIFAGHPAGRPAPVADRGHWLAWIYKALVLLVIACPCALVISTPVTVVSGPPQPGGNTDQRRRLAGTRPQAAYLALDKTGTITQGKPEQTAWQALDPADAAPAAAWRPALPAGPTIRSPRALRVPPSKTA